MKISSNRLLIVPLVKNELLSLLQSPQAYAQETGYKVDNFEINPTHCEEISETIEKYPHEWVNNSNDYLFYTLWLIVEKQSSQLVGKFQFNGHPNHDGEVEVFFGIEPRYRRNGFGCEAMNAIIDWSSKNNLFKKLLIEADFENKAAMASLKKLNFKRVCNVDEEEEINLSTKFYKKIEQSDKPDDNISLDFET